MPEVTLNFQGKISKTTDITFLTLNKAGGLCPYWEVVCRITPTPVPTPWALMTGAVIRFPVISCAPSDIWSIADSLDRSRVFADSTQTPDRLLPQLVVIPVRAVRPVRRTQVMPQVLHRIQRRRARRQSDQAHYPGVQCGHDQRRHRPRGGAGDRRNGGRGDPEARSILPNRHNPWNRSARNSRTPYYLG